MGTKVWKYNADEGSGKKRIDFAVVFKDLNGYSFVILLIIFRRKLGDP